MLIPDFLPQLRTGTGNTPQDGGCLVQVAGFLYDGHSWTDDTPCVHPVLRAAGIAVNDKLDPDGLRRLALLTARISGSADVIAGWSGHDQHVLSVRLAVWAARSVLREGDAPSLAAITAADRWCDGLATTGECAYAATTAATTPTYAATTAANAANAAANPTYANAANANAAAVIAAAVASGDLVDWYTALVGEYDRLTHRTSHNLTREQADRVLAHIGAGR